MWQALKPLYYAYSLIGEAWEQQMEYFAYFMENIPASAWITDAQGTMLYANACYYRTFPIPDDIIGKSVFTLYSKEIATEYVNNIQRVAQTNQAIEVIEPGQRVGQSDGLFLVYKFPITVSSQETLVGGVAIDITHQKEAEATELRLAKMAEVNKIKETFFLSISHDMRNPLTSILMTVEAIRRQMSAVETSSEMATAIDRYLSIITAECTGELTLIDTLLQIQQIEAHIYPLAPLPVQMQYWLLECFNQFEHRLKAKNIEVEFDLHDDLPIMTIDAIALNRIVVELLQNAYKYTLEGGLIKITACQDEDQMQVTICNTGELSAQALDRIFDPFFRLHKTNKVDGFGIGLSLIKTLTAYLNGTLTASSSNNQVVFALRLPLQGKEYCETIDMMSKS